MHKETAHGVCKHKNKPHIIVKETDAQKHAKLKHPNFVLSGKTKEQSRAKIRALNMHY